MGQRSGIRPCSFLSDVYENRQQFKDLAESLGENIRVVGWKKVLIALPRFVKYD
jgi:hypothetical protein